MSGSDECVIHPKNNNLSSSLGCLMVLTLVCLPHRTGWEGSVFFDHSCGKREVKPRLYLPSELILAENTCLSSNSYDFYIIPTCHVRLIHAGPSVSPVEEAAKVVQVDG